MHPEPPADTHFLAAVTPACHLDVPATPQVRPLPPPDSSGLSRLSSPFKFWVFPWEAGLGSPSPRGSAAHCCLSARLVSVSCAGDPRLMAVPGSSQLQGLHTSPDLGLGYPGLLAAPIPPLTHTSSRREQGPQTTARLFSSSASKEPHVTVEAEKSPQAPPAQTNCDLLTQKNAQPKSMKLGFIPRAH